MSPHTQAHTTITHSDASNDARRVVMVGATPRPQPMPYEGVSDNEAAEHFEPSPAREDFRAGLVRSLSYL